MQAQVKAAALSRALDWGRLLGAVAISAAVVGVATHSSDPVRSGVTQGLAQWVAQTTPVTVQEPLGADVDGDGKGDFVNPTGGRERGHDAFGSGEFGASRDGGLRRHEGVDVASIPGQVVEAPIAGYVSKIGFAYPNSPLRFVEITNGHTGYKARVFYVGPSVFPGERLSLGQTIGRASSLQGRYAGITDHVHLEVMAPGGRHVDPAGLIPVQV
jgi:murein DD-endopeptidase MepM/ murein hydrolase activator NlpD